MTAVAEPHSARTILRRACPHDCPDACATLVRSPLGQWLGNSSHQGASHADRLHPFAFVDDPDGSLLASFAFTDVGGGANFDSDDPRAGIQTIARQDGDRLIVSGQKHYTTNGTGWDGNGAALYTVVCRTDPSKGASEALTVVVVPGNRPGIEVVDVYDKLGQRGIVTPRVDFNDVDVPLDHMIGQPGDGKRIVSGAFSWTAALIGAACVGTMRAAFDTALAFARREHRLGSKPIIEHQNVGFMLADIKMRIEAARYLTWKACHYLDTTDGRGEELAIITKVYCSELAVQVVYDAMRLVGVERRISAAMDRMRSARG